MAKQVTILLRDDMDGSEAVRTTTFALDGRSYEIDLSEHNDAELRGVLQRFVKAARRTGPKVVAASDPAQRARTRAIRQWAMEHGYEIAERGRLSSEIVSRYEAAHV